MLREKSKAGPEKCVKGLKAEIARVRLWCTFFSLGREKKGVQSSKEETASKSEDVSFSFWKGRRGYYKGA